MNDPRYSTRFEAVGYGNTSPANSGAGTRRIKQRIRVYCIPGDELIDCPADANINPNEFVGGDGTCEGDSGSSAYEESTFDTPSSTDPSKSVSFGVLSRGGVSTDGTLCEGSLYTRLDKWRDLVIQAADDASANWTNYPKPKPDWTVYVPPPVTDAGTDGKVVSTTPSGKGFGEPCADASECASKTCIDPGDGNLFCSKDCTADADCPEGYSCPAADQVCVASKAKSPTTTTTTSGCAVAADPRPTPWRWAGVALALSAVAAARRRRRG
jgi:MYXO-CTERM domain-containing protein